MSDGVHTVKPAIRKIEDIADLSPDFVRIPIRQYSSGDMHYTVCVCADHRRYRAIFYSCVVRQINEIRNKDMFIADHHGLRTENYREIVHELIDSNPIPRALCAAGERKSLREVGEKRFGFLMSDLKDIIDNAREAGNGKKKVGKKGGRITGIGKISQQKTLAPSEDDGGILGKDEVGGGLMGIYCRSEMHSSYSG